MAARTTDSYRKAVRAPPVNRSSDEGEQDSSEADDDDAFAAKCEEELGLLKPLQQEIEANESVLIGRYFSSATEEVKKVARKIRANLRWAINGLRERKTSERAGFHQFPASWEQPAMRSVDEILDGMVKDKSNHNDVIPGPWSATKPEARKKGEEENPRDN